MTLTEKVAYIKGLAEGMKLDEKKDENKIIKEMLNLLEDMALTVTDMESCMDDVCEQVDAVDEDLSSLEDAFMDAMEDDDCDFDDFDGEELYEVTCPQCGEEICVEEDVLLCGEIECPNCGENLEFDFSTLNEEHGECDCGHCGAEDDSEDLMS